MLRLKEFSDREIILVDENNKEYILTCKEDNQKFDRDVIEDILDWEERTKK